ncbi:hypothetical protein TeGR_g3242 [Tetraparma gracilis]|uniref:Uncharacterized protein n=1 Tax=Tetraparma gracilis TaxID=2962635 RepID=A0ABQ6M521_9STRA|nr:hypothetical protein TeGR_g3242 [Tetraparma gracilis]
MGCCPSGGDIIISSGCSCTEKQTCLGPATPSPTPAPPPRTPSPTPGRTSSPTYSYDDDDYEGDDAGWVTGVKIVSITLACVLCVLYSCHRAEQWYRYEYIGDERKPHKAGKATGGGKAVPPGGYVAYAPLATARDKECGGPAPYVPYVPPPATRRNAAPTGGYVAYVPPPATGGGKARAPPAGEEPLSDFAALSTDALERELARRKAEAA